VIQKELDIMCRLGKLHKNGITPTEYCFLVYIHKGEKFPYNLPSAFTDKLLKNKWVTKVEDNFEVTKKFHILTKTFEEITTVDSWIDSWRDLWPKGVYTMGRPVRGDKQGCSVKMSKFVGKNPEVSKEAIFDATRLYLYKKSKDNYEATVCADYFISKQAKRGEDVSVLKMMLEEIAETGSLLKNTENGGGLFHKEI